MLAATLWLLADPALAQSPALAPKPSFEVASVKPNNGENRGSSWRMQPGGRFTATNLPLAVIIRNAFDLQSPQVVGLPDWASSARFELQEQLGLKLESVRVSMEVLVIDSIERPTPD